MLALGYEGPETVGTLVAAAAVVVAGILLTLLVIRSLMGLAGHGSGRQGPPTSS